MPTTHDLTGWASRLATLIQLTDLDDPEQVAALHECADTYEGAVADKVGALSWVLTSMQQHSSICKEDAQRARAAEAVWSKRATKIRDLMQVLLLANEALSGESKVSTTYGTASVVTRTEYTYPTDVCTWPPGWVEVRVETKLHPLKDIAKAAIKAGEVMPGFGSHQTRGLMWRATGGKG